MQEENSYLSRLESPSSQQLKQEKAGWNEPAEERDQVKQASWAGDLERDDQASELSWDNQAGELAQDDPLGEAVEAGWPNWTGEAQAKRAGEAG